MNCCLFFFSRSYLTDIHSSSKKIWFTWPHSPKIKATLVSRRFLTLFSCHSLAGCEIIWIAVPPTNPREDTESTSRCSTCPHSTYPSSSSLCHFDIFRSCPLSHIVTTRIYRSYKYCSTRPDLIGSQYNVFVIIRCCHFHCSQFNTTVGKFFRAFFRSQVFLFCYLPFFTNSIFGSVSIVLFQVPLLNPLLFSSAFSPCSCRVIFVFSSAELLLFRSLICKTRLLSLRSPL